MRNVDKYYYYPIDSDNIVFVKGEKYICLSDKCNGLMRKHDIYIVYQFFNNQIYMPIIFKDEYGKEYRISSFDSGYFMSLKKYRKLKLLKLKL